jgi:hypothetical protein
MTTQSSTEKQLSIEDLKSFRADILQLYNDGMNKLEDSFQQGTTTQSQFDHAVEEFQKLKIQATKLLGLIINMSLDTLLDTNTDNPVTKIRAATKSLQKATQNINIFLDFLQKIAEVIRIAAGIIVAIQTGSIAKL